MLKSLAGSFDQELKDKERDMNQANALLGNIQTEILESQRSVGLLKTQTQGLAQSKQNLLELEDELRAKMGRRSKVGWDKWVKGDEEREEAIRKAQGGEVATTSIEGEYWTSEGVNVTDLANLHADIPTDPAALEEECEKLRTELAAYKKRRLDAIDDLARFQTEAGTGGRMADYRRLIGAGCGGVPPGEVDNVIGMLLEVPLIAYS